MVGIFHENWSDASLNEALSEEQPQNFKVARKPVLHADMLQGRPRAKTLGPQPRPLGFPVHRVPVSSHSRSLSEETLCDRNSPQSKLEELLPMVEPTGGLDIDLHQFKCYAYGEGR